MTSRRTFGEELRTERERRGITLETIARRTKIGTPLLTALERGDCSRWPGGIYSRAYVRAYADAIGLDREKVATRFSQCFADTAFPDRAPVPEDVTSPVFDEPPLPLRLTFGDDPPERRHRSVLARVIVVVLDLFLVLGTATVLSAADGLGFWVALAWTSLFCHAIALAWGGRSIVGLFARVSQGRLLRSPRRHARASDEPVVAEPA